VRQGLLACEEPPQAIVLVRSDQACLKERPHFGLETKGQTLSRPSQDTFFSSASSR
jgi:hypothetical protein